MLDRSSYHKRFAGMLGGDDEAVTPWLADPTHIARLRVYRNNVVTAWGDALRKNYPTVDRLVGPDFMRGMVVAFTKVRQPESPVLTLYGEGFADFIDGFPPAEKLPYLADVARLDRAWTEAFFEENVPALKPDALVDLDESEMAALRLRLHPSVRLLASAWNAHEIWQANRAEGARDKITLRKEPSIALLWWSSQGMTSRALSSAEAAFTEQLMRGATLGEALEAEAQENLLTFFAEALTRGLFVAADQ